MTRHCLATLIAALFLALAPVAGRAAGCAGSDLIAAMPDDARAALEAKVDAVPFARGLIWRATRGEAVVYLVGTYHFDDPRHDAMMRRVAPLLDQARTLLLEAGPEEEAALTRALAERPEFLFITEGPTLIDILPPDDWTALAEAMRARGVAPFLASRFRPWYVSTMLGLPPCAMDAMKAGAHGLDRRLLGAARDRGVPLRALEPYDTLFSLFRGMRPDQEVAMIRTALLMEDRAEDMATTLANAYFDQNVWAIWEYMRAEALGMPGLDPEMVAAQIALAEETLMTARNARWIPVILDAARDAPVLAAFGALHLPGRTGVPALLEAEGFVLERLD
jgi:uncharacterized protein YbaP (TraB family)